MKLKLSFQYVVTFLALSFLMHELHEIVHTTVGRIICGCWGYRDFNVWGLCDGCLKEKPISILATFAGPIFTFMMIWIGTYFIKDNKSDRQKAIGFSLIFANMPFGRIITAIFGGGDEVFGLKFILENRYLAWIIGLTFVLTMTTIPLIKAFKIINNERKIGWFLLFLICPLLFDFFFVLGIMNFLLNKGILDSTWILGSPMLVTIWTLLVIIIFVLTRKNIFKLNE